MDRCHSLRRIISGRKIIWTLPARRCVPCNLHAGICTQCLEFFPSLRTLYCNTFRTLRCRNRRDGRIFYYQPLSLLFVKPKQWLDVQRVSKGGIAGKSGEKLNGRVASVWGCNRRETGQAVPTGDVCTSSTANREGERE
jgi:hypothetical protein